MYYKRKGICPQVHVQGVRIDMIKIYMSECVLLLLSVNIYDPRKREGGGGRGARVNDSLT